MDTRVPAAVPQTHIRHRTGFRSPTPVLCWATLGATFLLFQLYVLGRWITGPGFVPTDPGSDPISHQQLMLFDVLQIIVPLAAAFMAWKMLFQPWIRARHLTTDGRILIAAAMVFFWDMSLNYSSIALFYNSHFVNFGAWANGSWPGWFSPTGNLLPEPFLFIMPAYLAPVFSQALFICWLLRKIRSRRPDIGVIATLAIMVIGLTIVDSIVETIFLRTGMYAYPGSIAALTLWAGKTYQFPLTEGFLFGGLGITAAAAVYHFRDDKGDSFTERGIERLGYSPLVKSWMRTLAIYGFIHTAFFVLYFIPCQFVTLNADTFP